MKYSEVITDSKHCVIFENGRFIVSSTPLSQSYITSIKPDDLPSTKSDGMRTISLDITDSCNLDCIHCSRGSRRPSDDSLELSTDEVIGFLSQLRKTKVVSIMGGEPLLRRDISKLLEIFSQFPFEFDVVTNLTILRESHIKGFAPSNIKLVISLDGVNATTHDAVRGKGAFERTKNNLFRLIEAGLHQKITLSMSVMRLNFNEVADIINFGLDRNISSFHFPRLKCEGNAKTNWRQIALSTSEEIELMNYLYCIMKTEEVKISGSTYNLIRPILAGQMRDGCPSIGKNVSVDAHGEVYPCGGFMSPQYSLGNLRDFNMSLDGLLKNNIAMKNFKSTIRERSEAIKENSSCAWRFLCSGGCPACADLNNDSIMDCDSHCDVYQSFFGSYILNQSTPKGGE